MNQDDEWDTMEDFEPDGETVSWCRECGRSYSWSHDCACG